MCGTHRGTKEMDLLLGEYVKSVSESLDDDAYTELRRFLEEPDPLISDWIICGTPSEKYSKLIASICKFHSGT